jgi:hypothetical protein
MLYVVIISLMPATLPAHVIFLDFHPNNRSLNITISSFTAVNLFFKHSDFQCLVSVEYFKEIKIPQPLTFTLEFFPSRRAVCHSLLKFIDKN